MMTWTALPSRLDHRALGVRPNVFLAPCSLLLW